MKKVVIYNTPEGGVAIENRDVERDGLPNKVRVIHNIILTTDYPDICTHGLDRKDCRECS